MADISASKVMELRQRTGLGMMECKKALTEADGDMTKAEDLLRIKSGAKASKAADRIAAEGVIGLWVAPDAKTGAMVEVNCETDFVAKNDDFKAFAAEAAQVIARDNPVNVAALGERKLASGETVEARRVALVQKIGENMTIRRFARKQVKGTLASYVHTNAKVGVLVDVEGGEAQLGKDVAMQIAWHKPVSIDKSGVSPDVIAKEREIAAAQVAAEGKTGDMAAKIIEGKVNKVISAMTLLGQAFVKNDKQTVEQLLKASKATVHGFTVYVVGEGIERKKDDFAAEVAAMAKV